MAEDAAKEATDEPPEAAEAEPPRVDATDEPAVAQAATAEPPDADAPSEQAPAVVEAEDIRPPPSAARSSVPPPAAQEPDRSAEASATRKFLETNASPVLWWRRVYSWLYVCHVKEDAAHGDAFSPAILTAAKALGFRPVAILREGVFPGITSAEQWIGPDGYVCLEGNRALRKVFLSTYFEDATAVSTWPPGMVSGRARTGGNKVTLRGSGNLEKDYAEHLATVKELAARDGKRPLRRGDPWLMKRVAEFYVRHGVGPAIVALSLVNLALLVAMVALVAWFLLA